MIKMVAPNSKPQTILELLKKRKFCTITHQNADIDSIASAVMLYECFNSPIIVPRGMNRAASFTLQKINTWGDMIRNGVVILGTNTLPSWVNTAVIVDTSWPESLGIDLGNVNIIIIDHHECREEFDNKILAYWCDEKYPSCVEMIYDIVQIAGKDISRECALLAMSAMIADTAQFRFASLETLKRFARLGDEHNIEVDDVFSMFEEEVPKSQTIAIIKAAQRMRFQDYRGIIIATSTVSAYEGKAAMALISLGADVVYVGSQNEDAFRVSGRASKKALRVGINLGRIMQRVSREFPNNKYVGGGHDGAAGLSGIGDVEFVLNMLVEETKKCIKTNI